MDRLPQLTPTSSLIVLASGRPSGSSSSSPSTSAPAQEHPRCLQAGNGGFFALMRREGDSPAEDVQPIHVAAYIEDLQGRLPAHSRSNPWVEPFQDKLFYRMGSSPDGQGIVVRVHDPRNDKNSSTPHPPAQIERTASA